VDGSGQRLVINGIQIASTPAVTLTTTAFLSLDTLNNGRGAALFSNFVFTPLP
jgi:hypothetical protein